LGESNFAATATAELPQHDQNEPLFDSNDKNIDDQGDEFDEDMERLDDEQLESDNGSFDEESSQIDGSDQGEEIEEEETQLKEDIYGRQIDAMTGKIVHGVDASKAQQKLEQLNEESDLTEEKRLALTKSIRSIFNRFAQNYSHNLLVSD
jgi:hypothetical protein